jgi:NADH:ubiquinone oxidoreductase subunit 6 (subunit J)
LSLILFYLLAAVIVVSGILVVTLRNVFHSALALVLTFFTVAGIYLMLSAEFLAAVQVLIYVGAVTILILFAIMLTHQIQSNSIRQSNEQVIPAALISIIFLVLAIFAMTRTFGGRSEAVPGVGAWTAAIDAKKLSSDKSWHWTVSLEDNAGKSYIAGGSLTLVPKIPSYTQVGSSINNEADPSSGYLLSSKADFTVQQNLFGLNETIYLKAWSDQLAGPVLKEAIWTLVSSADDKNVIIEKLINSNPETIGQLMMSKYVLPFEVVSVLLLVALIGAIVISRKEK